MEFGQKLENQMKQAGLSKNKLGKLSGVPRQNIIEFCNGKRTPTNDVLKKLASVKELGVSLEQLLAWKLLDEYDVKIVLHAFDELFPEALDREHAQELYVKELEEKNKQLKVEQKKLKEELKEREKDIITDN